MIVDTFPLGYGPEVLLLRLRTLSGLVDRHVIVELDATFSGKEREPLWPSLVAHDGRFAPFADLVEHYWLHVPRSMSPWEREEWTRSQTLDAVRGLGADDPLVILGDADEIPHPGAVRIVQRRGYDRARLYGRYHEWYLDLSAKGGPYIWEHRQPIMFRLSAVGSEDGASLRARQWHGSDSVVHQIGYPGTRRQAFAGWHFTLQGGAAECAAKLRSTAHTELSWMREGRVQDLIDRKVDILDRCPLERVHLSALPAAVFEDMATFGPMLTDEGREEIDIARDDGL